MSPAIRRRILYVLSFEVIAIAIVGIVLAVTAGRDLFDTSAFAAASSAVAVAWNYVYTALFEFWEARRTVRGRSLGLRIAHAVGFEAGLVVLLVPLMAWWLDMGLVEALLYDLGLVAFFLVYTFAFNLAFDVLFGLPASALPPPSDRYAP